MGRGNVSRKRIIYVCFLALIFAGTVILLPTAAKAMNLEDYYDEKTGKFDPDYIYTIGMEDIRIRGKYLIYTSGVGTAKNEKLKLLREAEKYNKNIAFKIENTSDGYQTLRALGSDYYFNIESDDKKNLSAVHNWHKSVKVDSQKFRFGLTSFKEFVIRGKVSKRGLGLKGDYVQAKDLDNYPLVVTTDDGACVKGWNVKPIDNYSSNTKNGEYRYDLNEGGKGATIVDYYGKDGDITLPSSVEMMVGKTTIADIPVTNVCLDFLDEILMIDKMTIPEGVTRIEKISAKDGVKVGPKEIVLPSTIKKIDDYAFYNDTDLKELILPDNIEKLGLDIFYGCKDLKIKINKGTTTEKVFREVYRDLKVKDTFSENVTVELVGGNSASETGSVVGGGSGTLAILMVFVVVAAGIVGAVLVRRQKQKEK